MSTLREELNRRRQAGHTFALTEIVRLMVPLTTELGAHYLGGGIKLLLHPSALNYDPSGVRIDHTLAQLPPLDAHDKACLAPEERRSGTGQAAPVAGDARSAVFSLGAILYEMYTGASIGPAMRRPSEIKPSTPEAFELLLGKALVADREHRPADLGALAQALYNTSPKASLPPPPADESHLDHDEDFDVDVSLSMIPPASTPSPLSSIPVEFSIVMPSFDSLPPPSAVPGSAPGSAGPGSAPGSQPGSQPTSATQRLAEMKATLEADPRPRYVVVKDGMDHGPFSAVELLQQIATGSFVGGHVLRDTLSGDERPISDWDEFAPFAHQARLGKEVEKERRSLEHSAAAEEVRTQYKAFIGLAVLVVIGAGFAGWWFQRRDTKDDNLAVAGDRAQSIDVEGGLEGAKKGPGGPRGTWRPGSGDGDGPPSGSHPVVPGGLSCEGAQARYVEDYSKDAPPDLSAGAYGAVLNNGAYLNSCGVPPTMAVSVCAAVQNGRAVGVTVSTTPSDGRIAGCIAGAVRGMGFPSHPRLDVTRTSFPASQ